MNTKKILNLLKAVFCSGLVVCTMGTARADNGLGWKNGSDLLAVGLPALMVTLSILGYFSVRVAWNIGVRMAVLRRRRRKLSKYPQSKVPLARTDLRQRQQQCTDLSSSPASFPVFLPASAYQALRQGTCHRSP